MLVVQRLERLSHKVLTSRLRVTEGLIIMTDFMRTGNASVDKLVSTK